MGRRRIYILVGLPLYLYFGCHPSAQREDLLLSLLLSLLLFFFVAVATGNANTSPSASPPQKEKWLQPRSRTPQ
jgi:hypothetical protein